MNALIVTVKVPAKVFIPSEESFVRFVEARTQEAVAIWWRQNPPPASARVEIVRTKEGGDV